MVSKQVLFVCTSGEAKSLDESAGVLRRRRLKAVPRDKLTLVLGPATWLRTCAFLDIKPAPLAPLLRVDAAGQDGDRTWFEAVPTNLIADRDQVVVWPLEYGEIAIAERDALFEEAVSHFKSDDLRLEVHGGRWVLSLRNVEQCETVAPEEIGKLGMYAALPTGLHGRALTRFLNELQMLWHEHPVNRVRREEGRLTVDGLWPCFGGKLPVAPTCEEAILLGGSGLEYRGLARWLDVDWRDAEALPRRLDRWDRICLVTADPAQLEAWLRYYGKERKFIHVATPGNDWHYRAGWQDRLGGLFGRKRA